MNEVVVVTTYKRPELLHCCLKRIRAAEPVIPISIFPDRGSLYEPETANALKHFLNGNTQANFVPEHDYHGNSFNAMEALRWAFNEGWERIYYIEDDVMIHPDFFQWHREILEDCPGLFGSMGWIFNRHAPISDDILLQPWYYAIGTCFPREKLELVVRHATPRYYADMRGYIESAFPKSNLNSPFGIQHFEQDGLIQRVLDLDKSQTASPGIAKCDHIGAFGYNRGWSKEGDFFKGCFTFANRVARIEEFIADPYWRAEVFGREIVEREIGHELPKREIKYKITLPGEWSSEFVSELKIPQLPDRINSVPVPLEAKIVVMS